MRLTDELKDRSIISEMQNDIASDRIPLILYGAGAAGGFIHGFLSQQGVRVDEVAVDKEYLGSRPSVMLDQWEVISMEDVTFKYDEVNLIIGFYANGLPDIVKSKISSYAANGLHVRKVYLLDYSLAMRPERIFTYDRILEQAGPLEDLYHRLSDDCSKRTMVAFLNQRISMEVGCLDDVREANQYFPMSVVNLGLDEVFLDCGAFDGDSIRMFLQALQLRGIEDYKAIYAFEPDETKYEELSASCGHLHDVHLIKKGVWYRDEKLKFATDEVKSSMIDESGTETINVTTIDNVIRDRPVTFVKMDIQGAEYEALLGAERTISRNKPVLAICVYHRNDDLVRLPEIILKFVPDYKLYLRAHHSRASEVVLYALPA